MLRRVFAILVVPLVLAAGFGIAGAADPAKKPDQFRGISWGARVSAIQGLTQVDRDGDIIHYGRAGEAKQLGGIPLRYVTYSFYKDQFYHADIGYEGEGAFAAIQRSLEEKYGPPDAVRHKTDASGHPYEVAVWDWPGYVFIGNRHDKDGSRGRIFYFYAPLTDASAKAQGIAPAPTPASAPGKSGTYLVKKGDSLSRIAKRQGVTEADLAKANPGLTDKSLKAGATINLPAATATRQADSPAPKATTSETPPSGPTTSYTVKDGDILSKVANAHGVRTRDVIAANPGIKPDALRPGTVLRIPVAKAAPAPSPDGQPAPSQPETPPAPAPSQTAP